MPKSQEQKRDHVRTIRLSEADLERIEERMKLSGHRSFSAYARELLVNGELRIESGSFDPREVREELARIGNNMNQIARWANTERSLSAVEAARAHDLMKQVHRTITQAIRGQKD